MVVHHEKESKMFIIDSKKLLSDLIIMKQPILSDMTPINGCSFSVFQNGQILNKRTEFVFIP